MSRQEQERALIAVHRDKSMDYLARRNLVERIRLYLRRADFVYGYFPQLVMEEKASEWWCLFWYCVRRLDTIIDTSSQNIQVSGSLETLFRQISDQDFKSSFATFLQETSSIVPYDLIQDLQRSIELEKAFTMASARPAAEYMRLIDLKSVAPLRICILLNRVKGPAASINRFVVSLGRAVQLLDDLLDLKEDLAKGRLFITREELRILALRPEEIASNLPRVARLRNKWVMAMIWSAYDAAGQLAENNFTLAARGWFELTWKLIADEKAYPLHRSVLKSDFFFSHYIGASTLPFDLFPGSELLKYQLLHRPALVFLKQYKLFQASKAAEADEQLKVDLGELLSFTESGADRALPVESADPRRFIDVSDHFGLVTLRQEVGQILLETFLDWSMEMGAKMERDPVRAMFDLAGQAMEVAQAARNNGDDARRERSVRSAPDLLPGNPVIDFGRDCISLAARHQRAFQEDLRAWFDRLDQNQ